MSPRRRASRPRTYLQRTRPQDGTEDQDRDLPLRSDAVSAALLAEEYQHMRECAANERERLLLDTLWQTGARISEILDLQTERIGDSHVILLTLKERTHRLLREIPIPPALAVRLRAAAKQHGGAPFPYSYWTGWRIFKRLATAAGVIRVSGHEGVYRAAWPHLARHGFAFRLRDASKRLDIVQKALGHRSIASTQVYGQPTASQMQVEVRKMQQEDTRL